MKFLSVRILFFSLLFVSIPFLETKFLEAQEPPSSFNSTNLNDETEAMEALDLYLIGAAVEGEEETPSYSPTASTDERPLPPPSSPAYYSSASKPESPSSSQLPYHPGVQPPPPAYPFSEPFFIELASTTSGERVVVFHLEELPANLSKSGRIRMAEMIRERYEKVLYPGQKNVNLQWYDWRILNSFLYDTSLADKFVTGVSSWSSKPYRLATLVNSVELTPLRAYSPLSYSYKVPSNDEK